MHALARRSAICAVLLALGSCGNATGPSGPSDVAHAVFISSDIAHFWEAYDAGGKTGDAPSFQRLYLDRASKGLKDFIGKRQLTAATMVTMVRAYPNYFASIRSTNLRLVDSTDAVLALIRANYARIKELYPPAVFPPVTFLVGRFSTGGTTASSGMLIGSEFYSLAVGTPVSELGSFQRTNVHAIDTIPMIIAHEHTHILQAAGHAAALSGDNTLLAQSLMEGSADFVGELVSGGNINAKVFPYALANEAAIWADFMSDMNGKDFSRWLYNQGSATSARPGDLGYFVGYRVAEAYYNKTADKQQALKDIIEMRNAKDFLAKSGYAPGTTSGAPAARTASRTGL